MLHYLVFYWYFFLLTRKFWEITTKANFWPLWEFCCILFSVLFDIQFISVFANYFHHQLLCSSWIPHVRDLWLWVLLVTTVNIITASIGLILKPYNFLWGFRDVGFSHASIASLQEASLSTTPRGFVYLCIIQTSGRFGLIICAISMPWENLRSFYNDHINYLYIDSFFLHLRTQVLTNILVHLCFKLVTF